MREAFESSRLEAAAPAPAGHRPGTAVPGSVARRMKQAYLDASSL